VSKSVTCSAPSNNDGFGMTSCRAHGRHITRVLQRTALIRGVMLQVLHCSVPCSSAVANLITNSLWWSYLVVYSSEIGWTIEYLWMKLCFPQLLPPCIAECASNQTHPICEQTVFVQCQQPSHFWYLRHLIQVAFNDAEHVTCNRIVCHS
jgi:hypothetical protein